MIIHPHPLALPIWLISLIVSSICEKKCVHLQKMTMINMKPNPNVPYLEEESVSVSDWPEITYLAKLTSDNFQSIVRGHNPSHGIWNDPICLVRLLVFYHNLLEGIRLWNQKQNACWHRIQMKEKNVSSLDFNFLLLNPVVDENCVCWHNVLQIYLQENGCHV